MLSNELSIIQKQATQLPCVTIIVPLQETGPLDKKAALLLIEKSIQKAGDFLHNMHPQQAVSLLASLQALADSFAQNYDLTAEGIGLYVSPGYSKLVKFLFPVHEKIQIGETFAIRELLYLERYAIGYYVLQVNEKTAQCYKGRLNRLQEIKDGIFPRHFHDDYEYSRPAKASSYAGQAGVKGFERDKSVIKANRLKSFYRETDQLLTTYLGELPLIIAGPKKDISLLQEVSRHQKNIIGTINGNYTNVTQKMLEEHVWPMVKAWIDEKQYTTMQQLIEEKWRQHTADGITDVWEALKEGRGYRLIVEKDYTYPAFVDDKTGKLHLKAPKTAHHLVIDAVDEVLRLTIEKGGEVLFVKNGALENHSRISLIKRY
ncbi:hypothetical protein SAMN04488505_102215 [Chitinophaga rupis]|uniref:Uncharacterized protein n=1 Tax=Chitinophaga rupis TaxID=573321 RepID=A0A1H7PZR2_9BACT|nr:hypothetical protein [Chitinophaga rupis]SEL41320.1 hypothetical protein SAMN04488505_102215 [Chitinophaga rupis]